MESKIINNYPIDAVILWVDGNDEEHFNKISSYVNDKKILSSTSFRTRYVHVDEVKFTVDSILKNAPFIRNIYIVTDNQTPSFLDNQSNSDKYSKVLLIDHKIIFENKEEYLPTFNCFSIETIMFRIPNLAEHFVYFNDDLFLINKCYPSDFFINGLPVLRGKWMFFKEDRIERKTLSFLKFKINNSKAGFKKAQQNAAKLAGFKKYYKFDHTPHPLRKSTFKTFFNSNTQIEEDNIKYKFRNINHFAPQGLANHIEILNNTCVLKNDYQLVYFQSYKKPLFWYKLYFWICRFNSKKIFMCLQSLERCGSIKLKFILESLEDRINK